MRAAAASSSLELPLLHAGKHAPHLPHAPRIQAPLQLCRIYLSMHTVMCPCTTCSPSLTNALLTPPPDVALPSASDRRKLHYGQKMYLETVHARTASPQTDKLPPAAGANQRQEGVCTPSLGKTPSNAAAAAQPRHDRKLHHHAQRQPSKATSFRIALCKRKRLLNDCNLCRFIPASMSV